jgi:hypothetical protein
MSAFTRGQQGSILSGSVVGDSRKKRFPSVDYWSVWWFRGHFFVVVVSVLDGWLMELFSSHTVDLENINPVKLRAFLVTTTGESLCDEHSWTVGKVAVARPHNFTGNCFVTCMERKGKESLPSS